MTRSQLDLAAFAEALRAEFALSADVTSESMLVSDLELDSLDLINLVALCEELAGQVRTDGEFPVLASVADAYTYYTSLLESAACQPS